MEDMQKAKRMLAGLKGKESQIKWNIERKRRVEIKASEKLQVIEYMEY